MKLYVNFKNILILSIFACGICSAKPTSGGGGSSSEMKFTIENQRLQESLLAKANLAGLSIESLLPRILSSGNSVAEQIFSINSVLEFMIDGVEAYTVITDVNNQCNLPRDVKEKLKKAIETYIPVSRHPIQDANNGDVRVITLTYPENSTIAFDQVQIDQRNSKKGMRQSLVFHAYLAGVLTEEDSYTYTNEFLGCLQDKEIK